MKNKILDPNQKQETSYCIPVWLRDEQIKIGIATIKGRVTPAKEKYTEPIALVSFGPSLLDTWEKIRDFKYIMSCSGAHKFLLEHGVVPTWHIDVDPRPHKVDLMGPPHPDVEYLIASCCHPLMWKHLQGHNVKLWHSFDSSDEALRILPPEEWAVTGGCSVGVRTLTLANFLGFTDLHVFGLDGCMSKGQSHALAHSNGLKEGAVCNYDGVTYETSPSMLEAARGVCHELDQMPKVHATFYGEGLVQHMARNRIPGEKAQPIAGFIAFAKPDLISDAYRELNSQLHRENPTYGVGGSKHAETVLKLSESIKTTSILDYGCGKGHLAKNIPFPIWEYDPAVPGKDETPRAADLVICTDVLEHIEPDRLSFVLGDLARCTKKVGYFVIHTGPAKKHYADGRNTHLIQQGLEWWRKKLGKHFEIGKVFPRQSGLELHFLVGPLKTAKKKLVGAVVS